MDVAKARSLSYLKRSEPEIANALLDYITELRETARDKFETATTDQDRLMAQVEARIFRDLLSIFDMAQAIVAEEERKRTGLTVAGLHAVEDKQKPFVVGGPSY